jgi:hypothetical protein
MLTRIQKNAGISRTLSLAAWLVLLAALVLMPAPAVAQNQEEEHTGVNSGNYNIKQIFEMGYRWEGITGNRNIYNTFVNLNPGPRLFEHSLEMRSLNHQGLLFDNFTLHSFGYGGDPNNVTRLRAYKNRWYNFSATFRRGRNFWDYRLLANPLNPNSYPATVPAGTPLFNIPYSPHRMEITRRMSDYNITLAPQSPLRLRLGYSRIINEGPSLTTTREGTEIFVFQDWKTTLNSYLIGFDFKYLPKTNFSFDQFWHEYKGDTTWVDPMTEGLTIDDIILPRPIYRLSNGQLVDVGTSYNFPVSQPCSSTATSPFITAPATGALPPTIKGACNGFLRFQRASRDRISHPATQFSFQTSYIPKLDLSGRMVYSTSDFKVVDNNTAAGYAGALTRSGQFDFLQGLATRTNRRQVVDGGPTRGERKSWTGDVAFTWYMTNGFRVISQFRYDNFRIPAFFDSLAESLFPVNVATAASLTDPVAVFSPGTAPPATCNVLVVPNVLTGCPRHTSSSQADFNSTQYSSLLKQRAITYQAEMAYDVSRHFGARLGYRFRDRRIEHELVQTFDRLFFPTLPNRGGCTPGTTPAGQTATNLPDGSCRLVGTTPRSEEEQIDEHALLFGLWMRANDKFRVSYDMELMYADHAFTRISPRHRQRYKLRASYSPTSWASIVANFNILNQRNNVDEIFHRQSNDTFAFAVSLMPDSWWGVDFGYDFNDVESRTNICFTLTTTPLPPGSGPCPIVLPAQTTSAISEYDNTLHFGFFNIFFKPVKRLKTYFGYTVSSTTGNTLILGPINAPRGTLAFNWHKPNAGVEIQLNKNVMLKSSWSYYGYNEKDAPDVFTSPLDSFGNLIGRDFRGNLFTTSVRFIF